MGMTAPPSVRLIPCRPYNGAPIGTTYMVHVFAGNGIEDYPGRKKVVQAKNNLLYIYKISRLEK